MMIFYEEIGILMRPRLFAVLILFFSIFSELMAMTEEDNSAKLNFVDLTSKDNDVFNLDQFLWRKRVIIVFAESPNHPLFSQQKDLFRAFPEELMERDIVILTDTEPIARTALRQQLRPRGFSIVIIGKDGEVKLRKPFPWSVREISRAIDKMPLRQLELQSN